MKSTWERIKSSVGRALASSLNPPARPEAIAACEKRLGATLPDEVKASLRVHDGQRAGADEGLVDGEELLCLEAITREWSGLQELRGDFEGRPAEAEGPVKEVFWNPRWIPVSKDIGGNFHCLDLDPAPGGNVGQVIRWMHDGPERVVVAATFGEWLEANAGE